MQEIARGTLHKMSARLERPVAYCLRLGDQAVPLNPWLGQQIRLQYSGLIHCVHCARPTRKSFNQGYCFPCFQRLAQCDSCIIHPEKCHYQQGTCREPEWGEQFCMQDHIVYLANSSGLKVGITRATQIPTRWIDQGAVQALAIIRVRSRLQSGNLEVLFRQQVADKTNWRDMLSPESQVLDLEAERDTLLASCRSGIEEMAASFGPFDLSILTGIAPVNIDYPVTGRFGRIAALSFDTTPEIHSQLLGIKGQYLMFEQGVINLRRFSGYDISFSA